MSDLCRLCWGSGWLFCRQDDKNRWFSCPQCNGVGTLRCHSPAKVKMHWKKGKKLAQINEALDKAWFFPDEKNPNFL